MFAATSPLAPGDGPFAGTRTRDRRGRGRRGPAALPGPLSPAGVPAMRGPRERFDAIALAVAEDVCSRWERRLGALEVAVEEIPLLPENWHEETVPLSAYVAAGPARPARLVLFRRPLEHRAGARFDGRSDASSATVRIARADLEMLLLTVVVEQVAEVLDIDPERVHPSYGRG